MNRVVEQQAWAVPINGGNPDFCESLEDRMKSKRSAPAGVHLGPFLPAEVRDLFLLHSKEKRGV